MSDLAIQDLESATNGLELFLKFIEPKYEELDPLQWAASLRSSMAKVHPPRE